MQVLVRFSRLERHTLPALKPFSVVPQQLSERIGIAPVCLLIEGVIRLDNDDLLASTFLEFFEKPVVKAANFNNCHKSPTFSGLLDELGKKFVNIGVSGTDLALVNDISMFITQVNGKLGFVLVDSKVQHDGLRRLRVRVWKNYFIAYERPLRLLTQCQRRIFLNIISLSPSHFLISSLMHIILANTRGFCAGVNMAIKALTAALDRFGTPIYVYHEIVHNTWVVSDFRRRGVVFVDDIDAVPHGSRLLFSAHGVAPSVRQTAVERNIQTIDATCPLVSKVHREVIRFASEGYTIIMIGHRGHDEVVGTVGEAPEYVRVVENEQEIDALSFSPEERLAYLSQTTLSLSETHSLVERLRQKFPQIVGPPQGDICYATQNRQSAVEKLAAGAEIVLVVGSRNSSNSRRLAERAESLGICSYLVDGPDDIATGWFSGNENILMTAGASAPESVVQQCVDVLQARFQATLEERLVCTERIKFDLPKELCQDLDIFPKPQV